MEGQNQEVQNEENKVELVEKAFSRVTTIRCLSAIPEDVEALLAEIAAEEGAE